MGKTILAQQICFRNATTERKAIYYSTISEPPEKFISHMEALDFFDRNALADKVEFINLREILQDDDHGLPAMVDEIVRKCIDEHPAIVVIDSAKALRDFISGERSLRNSIYPPCSTCRPYRLHLAVRRRIHHRRARIGARVLARRRDP
ncbi:MAG: RAD55 family ATPase [Candidatus Dormibacteraceae bacterium]